MKSRWVLFDLDGTLTRSEEGIWNCVRHTARTMGLPVPDDKELREFIGPPLTYSFKKYMGMTDEQAAKALEIYRERYTSVGLFENRVYPGVRNVLRILRRAGVKMGIVTGKPENSTVRILEHFGLKRYFDTVVCAAGEHAEKDQLILRALPEDHGEAWMVGDRCFDMEGGVRTGLRTIGAGWGYGTEEELRKSGAEFVAGKPEDIAEIICPGAEKPEGAFIAVEGLDGSGKGTQIRMLTDTLDRYGFEVVGSREPGGSPIGEKIRDILLDRENSEMTAETEALLYAASRAQHVREVIRPAVTAGKTLICDRFVDSSVAYQGGGRQLGVDRVLAINAPALDGTLPDAAVYLDIGYRESLSRRRAATEPDRLEMENDSFYSRVEEAYHQLISRDPGRFIVVSAVGDPERIAAEIAEKVLALLMEAED